MVSEDGICVLSENSVRLLLPTQEEMRREFEYMQREHPEDELGFYLAMEHGAVSRDGRLIAVGSQDSSHLVYNDQLELIGDIGNQSEYPHYAVFSADQSKSLFSREHALSTSFVRERTGTDSRDGARFVRTQNRRRRLRTSAPTREHDESFSCSRPIARAVLRGR